MPNLKLGINSYATIFGGIPTLSEHNLQHMMFMLPFNSLSYYYFSGSLPHLLHMDI
jgi:hypothetical protein